MRTTITMIKSTADNAVLAEGKNHYDQVAYHNSQHKHHYDLAEMHHKHYVDHMSSLHKMVKSLHNELPNAPEDGGALTHMKDIASLAHDAHATAKHHANMANYHLDLANRLQYQRDHEKK